MNAATQRFTPREPAPRPVRVKMIWGFYFNLTATTFFLYSYDEKIAVREHEGYVSRNGDTVSQIMKKPESHLEAIGNRKGHEVVCLGGA